MGNANVCGENLFGQRCENIRRFSQRMLTFGCFLNTMYRSLFTQFLAFRRWNLSTFMIAISIVSLSGFCPAQGDEDTLYAVAIFNQAQEAHEKGDLPAAIKLYEKALKIVPEFPEAEYQRGIALLALGRTDEAEKAFRRAVELRSDWTLALTSLASILVQKNQFAQAEPMLNKVIELEPQNSPAFAAITELRLKTKASPLVLQELLARITILTAKANPTAALWASRAALETALGKRDLAKTSLANALNIDARSKSALYQLADVALFEGDTVRASEIAGRLEKLATDTEPLILLKANILAAEGKSDEAIKLLDSINEPSSQAVELRTKIIASGSKNTAELEKQLETDARNPTILGRLCSLYRVADPAKALDRCRRAAEAEPANINHAVGFGAALVQAKQFEAAVIVLRKIAAIAPDNSTVHANLGTALFQLKRYADAKIEFEWLVAKQPTSAAAYYFLAITHDQLGEYLDSMADYQQYLRLADPVKNKLEIDKVNLRLPILQRQIKEGKGKHQ